MSVYVNPAFYNFDMKRIYALLRRVCHDTWKDYPCDCSSICFSNKSETLPVESQFNITAAGLSPDGNLLIAVNEGMWNYSP